MVHALREAWRVMRAAGASAQPPPFDKGVLLDIRPLPGDPLVGVRHGDGRETRCGALRPKDPSYDRHAAADGAVEAALAQGWFVAAATRTFDWIDEYETLAELLEDVEEEWSTRLVDEDAVLGLVKELDRAGRGTVPVIRQSVAVRALRKVFVV